MPRAPKAAPKPEAPEVEPEDVPEVVTTEHVHGLIAPDDDHEDDA